MRVACLVALIACGPGLKQQDPRDAGQEALAAAAGDEGAMARLVRVAAVNAGVWFLDPACAAQFPQAGEIPPDKLAAFAHCLVGLHLQPSPRKDALGDVVVMTYGPGFELEARMSPESDGPRLAWIGYVARRDLDDDLPTVAPAALEGLRITGDRDGPLDPTTAAGIELDELLGRHGAFSWLKVCIDADGSVTSARPYETTSQKASTVFVAAATAWKFRPFVAGGPMPVCAVMRLAYPPNQLPAVETIPLPPPPSHAKHHEAIVFAQGVKRLEAKRIAGRPNIIPDDHTKLAIADAMVGKVIGSFRLCLDDAGHAESVLPIKSTGFAAYDREIVAQIHTWVYSPYLIDGEAFPVCTEITFIYSQNGGPSRRER